MEPAAGTPDPRGRWPELPWSEWEDTCDTLHLWTQVVGKVKLALCPPLNEDWQVAFHPTPRGLATGRIPYQDRVFGITFDFVEHRLSIVTSDGGASTLPLGPRSVADFYAELMAALRALGIEVTVSLRPSEVPDPIPFDKDQTHASYDRQYADRWWRIMLRVSQILDRYRSSFSGKSSPVLLWWGSFDLSVSRFCGRPAPPLERVPRFMKIAADQETIACGFWPGNTTVSGASLGEPFFFSYIYPDAPGYKEASVRPASASYNAQVGEFLLPYADVRRASAPEETILDFFQSTYEAAASLANWDPSLERNPGR